MAPKKGKWKPPNLSSWKPWHSGTAGLDKIQPSAPPLHPAGMPLSGRSSRHLLPPPGPPSPLYYPPKWSAFPPIQQFPTAYGPGVARPTMAYPPAPAQNAVPEISHPSFTRTSSWAVANNTHSTSKTANLLDNLQPLAHTILSIQLRVCL